VLIRIKNICDICKISREKDEKQRLRKAIPNERSPDENRAIDPTRISPGPAAKCQGSAAPTMPYSSQP